MLTKLVGEGVISVVSRGRRTKYRLADREAVRRALVPG
jgi:DNA-binding transcriptional regulator PaaX